MDISARVKRIDHRDNIGQGATEERPGVWMGGTWGLQQRILGGAGIDMGAEGSL